MGMDEIYNVYFNVINAMVVWLIKVLANGGLCVFRDNVIEMALESVHEPSFGSSYILYLAGFASNTVDTVSTFAVHCKYWQVLTSAVSARRREMDIDYD